MSILALDLGKQTGWAICKGGVIQSGSESFHGNRFSGGGMHFLNFRNWLNLMKEKFSNIEIEAVKNKGFVPQDDNEADSLALMFWAQRNFSSNSNYKNINKCS